MPQRVSYIVNLRGLRDWLVDGRRFALILPIFACIFLSSGCAVISGKPARKEITDFCSPTSPDFKRDTSSLLDPAYVSGNNIKTLQNGEEIFPAMLSAIRSAQHTINLETYVLWDGHVAREFVTALAERARAGVTVNVILDALGSHKMGGENLAHLRDAGVNVFKYHTILWIDPRRYNYRTHRKLLIVDGKVAFIGGVGIADQWAGNGEGTEKYRDNQYQVTGPVVAQLQGAFTTLWLRSQGDLLAGPNYFPVLTNAGPLSAQTISSSTWDGNLDFLYRLAIASAKKTLRIENAYFLPDKMIRDELVAAAKRGVKVEIIVPGDLIDSKLIRMASKRHYPELLKAGIKIYEYQLAMLHVKLMIVDDTLVTIGSGNFDNRSTRLNAEVNLNVLDTNFAAEQTTLFERDKAQSRETKIGEHRGFHPLQHLINLGLPMF
jgi:cardiolipin synthase